MRGYLELLNAVLPVLGIMAAGFVIRRLDWLSEEADASLMRVVINVLTPCLVADTILGNSAFSRAQNVFLPPLLGFVTTAAGFWIGLWASRLLGSKAGEPQKRTFALSVGICNYGYIPLPLAQLLFTPSTVGVLFVQNIGVELAMWLVGLSLLRGSSGQQGWRHLANPPVLAIVGTLLLNALIRREQVPDALLQGAHLLGQCAIPLGLILIGAVVADLLPELRSRSGWSVMGLACALRLLILPLLFLLLIRFLPASREIRQVLLLHGAMPAAVFPIIMARHFGGDAGIALRVVIGTSLVSILTMPVWLKLGLYLLGAEHFTWWPPPPG